MQFTMDFDDKFDDDEVHFAGFIANVDSDILKLKLDKGFKIRNFSREEGNRLLTSLERTPSELTEFGADISTIGWSEQFYVVENTFAGWVTTAGENEEGVVLDPEYDDANRVSLYLEPTIQRLRFLTCENVRVPLEYFYTMEDGKIHLKRKTLTPCISEFRPDFSLNTAQISELERFTREEIIPFRMPFLNLAFSFFESSFETRNTAQAFLSLVIALEIVLQPEWDGNVLAQNAANLLDSDDGERSIISDDVRRLYTLRNKLVHYGVFPTDNVGRRSSKEGDVPSRTRNYVRRVITKAHELGKGKEQLSQFLRSFQKS